MGRVLDALQRQQEEEIAANDPLAARIGEPSEAPDQEGYSAAAARIGSPSGPKSNEGAPLAFLLDEARHATPGVEIPNGWPEPSGREITSREAGGIKTALHLTPPPAEASSFDNAVAPVSRSRAAGLRDHLEPPVYNVAELDLSRLHTRLVLFTDPQATGCEQYRTLRTQLFHASERQAAQVIVLTSAVAGEGKTSTVLNLAWAIAQSKEKRVLVIDSDMRRPSVNAYLGLRGGLGLTEVVNDGRDVMSCVVRIGDQSLYVLASSREEAQPTELLSRERIGEMLGELRRYFDYILIDAPPVVPFADARLLANHADAIIMIVRAGLAGHGTIERAIEALPANRILGVVLNGADQTSEVGYYGYYSYGYNYSRQKSKPGGIGWRNLLRLGRGKEQMPKQT